MVTLAGILDNFPGNNALFEYKQKITSSAENNYTKAAKIMVPLKYLSNIWRTLEMLVINCEINLVLTSSKICVISNAAASQDTIFAITDIKLYDPVVTLSTQDNAKLLQNQKQYESKTTTKNAPNQYLDFLIDPSFQGENRLFALAFNAIDNRKSTLKILSSNCKSR